ncbi:hypothetical protein J23TS9_53710 [Paenibacillus sp. J23TS9]|nr:hypothetical protein J23TS9_53710 [Paenibacillus sp. J23TS9]
MVNNDGPVGTYVALICCVTSLRTYSLFLFVIKINNNMTITCFVTRNLIIFKFYIARLCTDDIT